MDLFAATGVDAPVLSLRESVEFDPLDWIVTHSLHGVDLNAESARGWPT
jgi:hypothetical protein